MRRNGRNLFSPFKVIPAVGFLAVSAAFSQDSASESPDLPMENASIEILDTESPEPTPAPSSELENTPILQELQDLGQQLLLIQESQSGLVQEQERIAAQLESATPSPEAPPVDLTPIQNELQQLQRLVTEREPTTPADEVLFEIPPDPYTEKIFVLNILVLVLVAILIFLNLFLKGKSRERVRSAGPAKKDLETILQSVNRVADQNEAIQANFDKRASGTSSSQSDATRQILESTLTPFLERLSSEDREATLVQKIESLQATLSAQDEKLSHFQGAIRALEEKTGAAREASERLDLLEQENARLTRELQEQKAEWSEKQAGVETLLGQSRALFPEWIHGEGPLEDIQNLLQTKVGGEKKSASAQRFLGQCLQLEGSLNSGKSSPKELAAQLSTASQAGYQFLLKDLRYDKDQIRKSMRTWINNLDQRLTSQALNLRLSQVFPGDSFQLATMEAVDSISGNRLSVDQPLSWLIEDTAESPPRVLQRAKVITA